jgi:hypothetical protein
VVKSLPTLTTLSLGSSYSAMSPAASGTSQAESRSGRKRRLALVVSLESFHEEDIIHCAFTSRVPERSVKGSGANTTDSLGYAPLR